MEAIYKFKNGKKVSVFLWPDLLEGYSSNRTNNEYRTVSSDGRVSKRHKKLKAEFDQELKQNYFELYGERKYFDDFEYMSVDQLIAKISLNKDVYNDDVVATFMKDTENVGLIHPMHPYDSMFFLLDGTVIATLNNDTIDMFCEIKEKGFYTKENFSYKVYLEVATPEMKKYFSERIQYTSDLISMILSGDVQLVNRKDCLQAIGVNPEETESATLTLKRSNQS